MGGTDAIDGGVIGCQGRPPRPERQSGAQKVRAGRSDLSPDRRGRGTAAAWVALKATTAAVLSPDRGGRGTAAESLAPRSPLGFLSPGQGERSECPKRASRASMAFRARGCFFAGDGTGRPS